jgi:hypothetical protein
LKKQRLIGVVFEYVLVGPPAIFKRLVDGGAKRWVRGEENLRAARGLSQQSSVGGFTRAGTRYSDLRIILNNTNRSIPCSVGPVGRMRWRPLCFSYLPAAAQDYAGREKLRA